MSGSKEKLIELVEVKSPIRDKNLKRNKNDLNQIESLSSISTVSGSDGGNIVNIFSVTHKSNSKRPDSSDIHTISEISDDIFLVKQDPRPSTGTSDFKKTYKEKISNHLKKIKEKASTSSEIARSRIPIERIRKQNEHLDAEIHNIKSKFKDRENNRVDNGFFTFIPEAKEDKCNDVESSEPLTYYCLPEKLMFSMSLVEAECYFTPKRRQLVEDNKKIGTNESAHNIIVPKIPISHKNILEQRFSLIDDRRWFDTEGNLDLLEEPITSVSLRPSNYSLNDPSITKYIFSSTQIDHELKDVVVVKENILDVYLSHIKFSHHPLYSAEHVFAEKLKTAFNQYKEIQESKSIQKLKEQLYDLRQKKVEHENLYEVQKQIKKVRNAYFKENKRYKEAILIILESWKHIKKIRAFQNFSNTNVKLIIKRIKPDLAAETEEYKKMFDDTLEELIQEYEKEEIASEDSIEADKLNQPDDESSITSKISKNEVPIRTLLKNQLKKTLKSCFKQPGDPDILFAQTSIHQITENPDSSKETSRRNVIFSTKFYLRLLCNNIEVCKTKFLSLSPDFTLEIEEIFSLQLNDVPEFLTIEIYEQPKSLLKRKLCELNIDIPTTKNAVDRCKRNFEKNDIVHYKHDGTGSGIELSSILENYDLQLSYIKDYTLKTSGYLEYSLEWEKVETVNKDNISIISKLQDLDKIIDKNFVIDYRKLKKFEEKEKNDNTDNTSQTEEYVDEHKQFFRLTPIPNTFSFCNITEIEENIRLKMLHLRDQKEIEFDGMLVPNRLKEIPINILSQYLRRKAGEEKGFNHDEMDEFKSQYYYGKKYLRQVHLKVFQMCKNTENNLDYESVVNENYFIYFHFIIKTALSNFFNWFRWHPKISKPFPILRRSEKEDTLLLNKSNIFLTIRILNGKNLPHRKRQTFNEENNTENDLCPFVEVSYKNLTTRTSTSRGSNPIWGEDLIIPLESDHMDYLNPDSLEGVISVNLFDESNTEVKKLNQKCMNWLGGVDILLSAICCTDCMNGYFYIKIPYILLDYETEKDKLHTKSANSPNIQINHTYLNMEICVKPDVPKLTPNMEELPCGDLPYIQEHVLKWNKRYNIGYPHRKFNAMVLNISGKTTCVTRFLKPLEPPQIKNEEFDVTLEQCIRYVSLIPFTRCNHFYNNIWLSTEQLINCMLGSIIDHAIALTCYLSALKLNVWLLLGYGIPHGNTAYVLLSEYSGENSLPSYYIIDVVFNEKYNVMDEHCPLQKIFCVMNQNNVWANIQKTDNITITRFDFLRTSDWLPLFDDNIPGPVNFICNKVTYRIKEDTETLEMNLEKQLKRQISKLRLLDRTIWNSGLSSVLVNVLRTLEMNCVYGKSHYETIIELNQDILPYAVSGFAINTHFTNFSSLVRKIKTLGIHVQQERDIEFSLAVYIHSYPGRVFSVWIFLVNVRNNE